MVLEKNKGCNIALQKMYAVSGQLHLILQYCVKNEGNEKALLGTATFSTG